MAQVIYCDIEDCQAVGNIMITNLDNGDVQAFCHPHYAEMIMNLAVSMLPQEDLQGAVNEPEKPAKGKTKRGGSKAKTDAEAAVAATSEPTDKSE
jgi:hypothetical protein